MVSHNRFFSFALFSVDDNFFFAIIFNPFSMGRHALSQLHRPVC